MDELGLFEMIEGKSGEPLVTQVLACLLKLPGVCSAVLECIRSAISRDSDIPPLIGPFVVTSEKGVEGGRPDLYLVSREAAIIIENKTWEEVKRNQTVAFAKWLCRQATPIRLLIFFVPELMQLHIHNEVKKALEQEALIVRSKVIPWEDVLKNLEEFVSSGQEPNAKLLLKEFIADVRRRITMGEPFTDQDLVRLADKNLATSLVKSLNFLNVLHPQLRAKLPKEWDFKRSDSRRGWWGWQIVGEEFRRKNVTWVWVGMEIDPWMWYGQSPFWLEVELPTEASDLALQHTEESK